VTGNPDPTLYAIHDGIGDDMPPDIYSAWKSTHSFNQ